MKVLRKNMRSKKGFTLVEIMIVILIIAVMTAILVPALGGAIRKAWESSAMQNASRAYEAAQILATEKFIKEGDGEITISESEISDFLGKANFFSGDSSVTAESSPDGANEGGAITNFSYTDSRGIVVVLDTTTGELRLESTGSPSTTTP